MNARPDQLQAIVAKNVFPVYMVSGDEPLQQMESLDVIRAYLKEKDYSEREVLDVDAQFDWQQLMDEAASMSLFATRRIVELRLPSAKPGRQGSQILKDYLSQPPDDTVLIINAGKIDSNAKKSAWYKAVEQSGLVVQCWPVPIEKLSGWLRQRFNRRGMEAEQDVFAYVSQHVEGNLLAADQEIEKLLLLLGPGKISFADVVEAGHKAGIWVGLCGEMGSETRLAEVLLGLGLDEISLHGATLPKIKQVIRWTSYSDAQNVVQNLINQPTAAEANAWLADYIAKRKLQRGNEGE